MGMGNFGFMGGFGMILFWGLLIALIVWGVRSNVTAPTNQSLLKPLEVLKNRYAAGEIDKDEYESKYKDLTS